MALIVTDNMINTDHPKGECSWTAKFTGSNRSSIKLEHTTADGDHFNIHLCYGKPGDGELSVDILLRALNDLMGY